jgi:hypothetical protein
MVRLRFDIPQVGIEPARAARNLLHGHLIHKVDHELYWSALRVIALARRFRFYRAAELGAGFTGLIDATSNVNRLGWSCP